MEELLRQLNQTSNEEELFEKLLEYTLNGSELAIKVAARIEARRDILFDLEKVTKENDNSRLRSKKTSQGSTKA